MLLAKHKGIIDSEDWLKVQEIYTGNSNKFTVSARSHNALLTGIMKCAKCGSHENNSWSKLAKKQELNYFTMYVQ